MASGPSSDDGHYSLPVDLADQVVRESSPEGPAMASLLETLTAEGLPTLSDDPNPPMSSFLETLTAEGAPTIPDDPAPPMSSLLETLTAEGAPTVPDDPGPAVDESGDLAEVDRPLADSITQGSVPLADGVDATIDTSSPATFPAEADAVVEREPDGSSTQGAASVSPLSDASSQQSAPSAEPVSAVSVEAPAAVESVAAVAVRPVVVPVHPVSGPLLGERSVVEVLPGPSVPDSVGSAGPGPGIRPQDPEGVSGLSADTPSEELPAALVRRDRVLVPFDFVFFWRLDGSGVRYRADSELAASLHTAAADAVVVARRPAASRGRKPRPHTRRGSRQEFSVLCSGGRFLLQETRRPQRSGVPFAFVFGRRPPCVTEPARVAGTLPLSVVDVGQGVQGSGSPAVAPVALPAAESVVVRPFVRPPPGPCPPATQNVTLAVSMVEFEAPVSDSGRLPVAFAYRLVRPVVDAAAAARRSLPLLAFSYCWRRLPEEAAVAAVSPESSVPAAVALNERPVFAFKWVLGRAVVPFGFVFRRKPLEAFQFLFSAGVLRPFEIVFRRRQLRVFAFDFRRLQPVSAAVDPVAPSPPVAAPAEVAAPRKSAMAGEPVPAPGASVTPSQPGTPSQPAPLVGSSGQGAGPRPRLDVPSTFKPVRTQTLLDNLLVPGSSSTQEKTVAETPATNAPAADRSPDSEPTPSHDAGGALASRTAPAGITLGRDVGLQYSLGYRDPSLPFDVELEQELLQELDSVGVDVKGYVERLKTQLKTERRHTTAFEIQLTFHRAIEDWRSSTRTTAVSLNRIIEQSKSHAQGVLLSSLHISTMVTALNDRIGSFDDVVQKQHGKFDKELDELVTSAQRKLGDVVTKIETLDKSVAVRLDAHVEAATTRADIVYSKCETGVTKLTEGLDLAVAVVSNLQTSLHAAEKRIHDVESRSASIARDLQQMDRSFDETLKTFKLPIVLPAAVGGLVGGGVGAFLLLLIWRLFSLS